MVYGNVNQGLSKELTYYNDASNELINSKFTINKKFINYILCISI